MDEEQALEAAGLSHAQYVLPPERRVARRNRGTQSTDLFPALRLAAAPTHDRRRGGACKAPRSPRGRDRLRGGLRPTSARASWFANRGARSIRAVVRADSSESRIRQPGHHCRRPRLTKRCRRSPPRSIMRIRSPTRTSRPRTSSPGVPTRTACKPRGSASGLYGVGTGPAEAPEPAPPETPKPVALESGLRPTALDSPREPEP